MNELSIEEKAKAYDEALKQIKECTPDENGFITIYPQEIFPELKESEDEKTIRDIKVVLESSATKFFKEEGKMPVWYDRAIAWLEKQGEKKVSVVDFKAKDWHVSKVDGKIYNSKYMEKKPTNQARRLEIEKGKWYVCIKDLLDNYTNKAFFKGDTYLSTQDGSLMPSNSNIPFEVVCPDTYFRDWTIKDAKDGDVLVDVYGNIGIFEQYDDFDWTSYCFSWKSGSFHHFKGDHENEKTYPATKEQRDVLLKAMADAGYTFDFEKKELKKIEQPELTEFEDAVKDMMDAYRDAIGDCDATTEEVKKHAAYMLSLIPHKPAEWSEEDERILDALVTSLNNEYFIGRLETLKGVGVSPVIDWLKSLKQRIGE